MKEIKMLVEDIREELEGAEHYAKLAAQYKTDDKSLADNYATLASQELNHVDMLHVQAARLINAQRSAGVSAPASMQAVWDWEHELMIDKTAKIRALLEMYKKT